MSIVRMVSQLLRTFCSSNYYSTLTKGNTSGFTIRNYLPFTETLNKAKTSIEGCRFDVITWKTNSLEVFYEVFNGVFQFMSKIKPVVNITW